MCRMRSTDRPIRPALPMRSIGYTSATLLISPVRMVCTGSSGTIPTSPGGEQILMRTSRRLQISGITVVQGVHDGDFCPDNGRPMEVISQIGSFRRSAMSIQQRYRRGGAYLLAAREREGRSLDRLSLNDFACDKLILSAFRHKSSSRSNVRFPRC